MDGNGDPLAGCLLKAKTYPASLGKVTGLPKTNARGESLGSWHAGKEAGRGDADRHNPRS